MGVILKWMQKLSKWRGPSHDGWCS